MSQTPHCTDMKTVFPSPRFAFLLLIKFHPLQNFMLLTDLALESQQHQSPQASFPASPSPHAALFFPLHTQTCFIIVPPAVNQDEVLISEKN